MIYTPSEDLIEALKLLNERAREVSKMLDHQYRQSELAKMIEQNRARQ